jgi:hypothetical protein
MKGLEGLQTPFGVEDLKATDPVLFPQLSTARKVRLVTNNLYRGYGKSKTGNMHDRSPIGTEARPSTVPNPKLTPYSAIFCVQVLAAQDLTHIPPISRKRNSMKIRILDDLAEKKLWIYREGKDPKNKRADR